MAHNDVDVAATIWRAKSASRAGVLPETSTRMVSTIVTVRVPAAAPELPRGNDEGVGSSTSPQFAQPRRSALRFPTLEMRDWFDFAVGLVSFLISLKPLLVRPRTRTLDRGWTVKLGRFEMSRTIVEIDTRS